MTGDVEPRFTGGDIRWVRGLAIALIIVGLGLGGYWAYLQLEASTSSTSVELQTAAADLDTALARLSSDSSELGNSSMVEVNRLARELFTWPGYSARQMSSGQRSDEGFVSRPRGHANPRRSHVSRPSDSGPDGSSSIGNRS